MVRPGGDCVRYPQGARSDRRRRALAVHRPRPQSAGNDQTRQRVHERAKLVPRLHDGRYAVGEERMLIKKATRVGLAAAAILALAGSAQAGGTLRVALTATDVPTTTGAPDNGGEGIRFLGFPVFESLVLWDLTRADKLADIRPGLAESWEQDANDKTKWVFHLRKGVKFHDGSDFNADAAIWNLDRFFKQDAPQFDPPNAAVTQARIPFVVGYRKIDGDTIEIANPRPLSYFPYMMPYMLNAS